MLPQLRAGESVPKLVPNPHVAGLLLAVILLAGLILRIMISPTEGYGYDVEVNQGWAKSAVQLGMAHSYVEQVDGNMLPNYPPFSMMIFAAVGHAFQTFISPDYDRNLIEYRMLIKLPAILADLGTAFLFFFLLKRWKNTEAGFLAAAIYTFHPAVIYDSAYWGQTDSIFTFFMVLALSLFLEKWFFFAGALIALALLTKLQTVMLGPLLLAMSLLGGWRAFFRVSTGAVVVAIAVLLPFWFGGTLSAVFRVVSESIGYFTATSSAAYNFWWVMLGNLAESTPDTTMMFGFLSYRQWGFVLFGLGNLYVFLIFFRQWHHPRQNVDTVLSLFTSAAFLSFTFFMFSTEMHERYLFPFVALGLPLIFAGMSGIILYGAVSALFFLNLLAVLSIGSVDQALFSRFPDMKMYIAISQCIAYFAFTAYLLTFAKTNSFAWIRSFVSARGRSS